ncbi:histidine phosphatase superfamily (branch 1) domain-containing protein [Hirsutella rhossiliensis]|uniref:Histidine phosphatase superfamily (Branch 1) domain-containing protein n=1 Tax=Hirsutella rhossiliensis TaxID=111463 RepID=A0A9P8SHC5_9HYPO|nr:histidine phosphatase superfamily (branch 1) domain-containing protein [Hirsutella rhossiliensis]KAH0960876.1 histidine phosphatase superfamily (branch 1) domain-containing protein [Hirsutella rhossiliensis]
MARPRLIIVIRHAQSEGNKNRDIHQTIPDHRVRLTPEGWAQANDAGRRLRALLRPDDSLQFFTSPYRRTRETTEGILATLTSDDPEPSPFRRPAIKVYEEPRLREQDFGNFQPCSVEMERMWQERADYGHFFYRIPNGESAADAYDRISGFNESLWRQFGDDDFPSVCVLVTHGLMSRVFLMKWYHFTVEYFEDLRNIDHCEFLTMRKQPDGGKYLLENKLRTWSELRRERAVVNGKDDNASPRTVVVNRRWGGCPNGCNHTNHFNKRHDLDALRQRDIERSGKPTNGSGAAMTIASRRQRHHHHRANRPQDADADDPGAAAATTTATATVDNGDGGGGGDDDDHAVPNPAPAPRARTRTLEDVLSSPDGTPSFITASHRLRGFKPHAHHHLHVGRDFGGSYSGHNSMAGSDSDPSSVDDANDAPSRRPPACHNGPCTDGHDADADTDGGGGGDVDDDDDENGECADGSCALANRLGDDPRSAALDDLDKAEREDRSVQGSLY